MKNKLYFCIILLEFIFLGYPLFANAAASAPTDLSATATATTITISWASEDSNTAGYYLYWGTSSYNYLNRRKIEDNEIHSYTLTNLKINTTYYLGISAYDIYLNESNRSAEIVVNTIRLPDTPTHFGVSALTEIATNSIILTWNLENTSFVDHYLIYYGLSSGVYEKTETVANNLNGFTVTSLTSATRYFFTIVTVDSEGNESAKAKEVIIDTVPDNQPPSTPTNLTVEIDGTQSVEIKFTGNNETMADLTGYRIYYDTTPQTYANKIDIGLVTNRNISSLEQNTQYYFSVSAYDYSGNESPRTAEVEITIENSENMLGDPDEFEGGCFIGQLKLKSKLDLSKLTLSKFSLLMALMYSIFFTFVFVSRPISIKWAWILMVFILLTCPVEAAEDHSISIKIGRLLPNDEHFTDYYKNDIIQFGVMYEYRFFKPFSLEIEAGIIKQKGSVQTFSNQETNIDSNLVLIPIASTLKCNIPVTPLIIVFFGGGPDFWYYHEKSAVYEVDAIEDEEYGVGGFHGKFGVRLFPEGSKLYRTTSVLFEGMYSEVDRFGENAIDLGGWTWSVGLTYGF